MENKNKNKQENKTNDEMIKKALQRTKDIMFKLTNETKWNKK
jgi:hypothetical protein